VYSFIYLFQMDYLLDRYYEMIDTWNLDTWHLSLITIPRVLWFGIVLRAVLSLRKTAVFAVFY
jgi:hypothetical protein